MKQGRTSSCKSTVRQGSGPSKKLSKAKAAAKKRATANSNRGSISSRKRMLSSAATLADFGPAGKEGLGLPTQPNVRRGLTRSTTVKKGPAMGWKVTAYLHKVKSRSESMSHDHIIAWRIVSPERLRAFDTFTSTRGTPNLRDAVSEGVYTHIYEAIRPGLVRKIAQRRNKIEGKSKRLRRCIPRAVPICDAKDSPPRARPRTLQPRQSPKTPASKGTRPPPVVTPAPLQPPMPPMHPVPPVRLHSMPSLMPMQLFAVPEPGSKAWACDCEAHLRRHPRCVFPGPLQPPLVHLRDYMVVGRAQSCDLCLDSRLTPQMLSRCHAVIHKESGGFTLTDQGSLNGLLVNGVRVREKVTLSNDDVVTFGVPNQQPELDYLFESRRNTEKSV